MPAPWSSPTRVPSVRASACSTTWRSCPSTSWRPPSRRHVRAGLDAQPRRRPTSWAGAVRARGLRAGPAAGVRPQSALLAAGRRRGGAAVSRRPRPRNRARPERRAAAPAVRASSTCCSSRCGRKTIATARDLERKGSSSPMQEARRQPRSRRVLLQPAARGVGEGPARARGCSPRSSGRRSPTPSIARPSPTPCSWAPPCRSRDRSRRATRSGSRPTCRATASTGRRRAKLLAGLGLANRDADEWLEDAKGTEARFTLLTYRATRRSSAARGARESLEAVGVAVDVVPLETGRADRAHAGRRLRGDLLQLRAERPRSRRCIATSGSAPARRTSGTSARRRRPRWEKQIDDLMTRQAAARRSGRAQAAVPRGAADLQRAPAGALLRGAAAVHGVSPRVRNTTPGVNRPQLLWSADTLAVAPAADERPVAA